MNLNNHFLNFETTHSEKLHNHFHLAKTHGKIFNKPFSTLMQ